MHLILAALVGLSHGQTARIDAIVATVSQRERIGGLSLAIARNGRSLYLRGYGFADALRTHPADGFTIYAVGSIAKQFAAATVLQEVARGRLALNGPAEPTVRELLDQTPSGLWRYDNANYTKLGEIVERETGETYCALLHERIAAPLHLFSTGCGWGPGAFNVAQGAIAPRESIDPAAGGLTSNARDLVRWLDALRTGRVVPAPLFAEMTRSGEIGGIPTNYGFGFFVGNWYGYRVVYHSGNVDGFSCEDALVLDDGLEIAALSNADRVDLVPLLKSIVVILDSPRDVNLYGVLGTPAQNENPQISQELSELLRTKAFAGLGVLQSLEFIERSVTAAITYDVYRATFDRGQERVTIGYDKDGTVKTLQVSAGDR